MAIYNIYAKIKTKVNHEYLMYEMELYKSDNKGNKTYALEPTGLQPLQADKKTLLHPSLDISDPENTSYILSIHIYHKIGAQEHDVLQEPMTAIVPLKGFLTDDKNWGISREFEYDETTQKTRYRGVDLYRLTIRYRERAFEAKEHPKGDHYDPFTKEIIQNALRSRLMLTKTDLPDQGDASLCGPAAFFYSLLIDRPDLYKQMVKELWESGKTKIGKLKIEPGEDCRHPTGFFNPDNTPRVSPIDWITLASLRDSENSFQDYESPDNQVAGITLASTLISWFEKASATILHEIKTSVFSQAWMSTLTLAELCRLNSYISADTHVVVLIGAKLLDDRYSGIPNHWIVWTDKLKLLNGSEITQQTGLTEQVQLELFSWGEVGKQLLANTTLKRVLELTYAALIVSKIP